MDSTGNVARLEVFTAMKIQIEVFWFVMPCSDVVGYKSFGVSEPHPQDGGSMAIRNVGILPHYNDDDNKLRTT
jgi:hypothetical protein